MRSFLAISLFVATFSLIPSSVAWGNTVFVDENAALEGGFGLAVDLNGAADRVYVQDNTPTDETVYRAEFLFRRSTLEMTSPNNHVILLGMQENPSPPHTGVIRLVIVRVGDGRYFIRAFAFQNTGAYRFVGGTGVGTNPNAIWRIGVEWQVSDPGQDNGVLRLYKNGGLQVERLDLINEGQEVDFVRLGAVAFLDGSTNGQYHVDSFSSFRTLAAP
jgi:hypothetical protein